MHRLFSAHFRTTRPGWILCFLLVFAGIDTLPAQQAAKDRLNSIRRQISALEGKLKEQSSREQVARETLDNIDKKISLTKDLIGKLRGEIGKQEKQIRELEALQSRSTTKLGDLQNSFSQRLVALYKRGRISTLELLLNAQSIRQVQVWAQYQRKLAANDARLINGIREQQQNLIKAKSGIESALGEKKSLLGERSSEESKLVKDRGVKQKLLNSLKRDRRVYQQQLNDYRNAITEIQKLIRESEQRASAERKKAPPVSREATPTSGNLAFSRQRGELPWPVKGEVTREYGPYQHPVLKTHAENLGIDIAAPQGTPVQAVANGKVTAITWQRGRGNLIIINHDAGYYTVYTHLDGIQVELQEDIRRGQRLGVVGEAGLQEQTTVHFQIWNKFDHLNPHEWLR